MMVVCITSQFFWHERLLSSVLRLLSSVLRPLSSVPCPLSSVFYYLNCLMASCASSANGLSGASLMTAS